MAQGGIYDHLGGGFARYATDSAWLVPHFGKMLYDNAQVLDLLAFAHAASPNPLYRPHATETVGWLLRDMTGEARAGNAAFAASQDADSEGEGGRYYVWTEAEIDAVLGPSGAVFKQAYDVTASGNWEGRTILHRHEDVADCKPARDFGECRALLLAARERRPRPGRHDKVLADWNGLAIAALCRAASVFDRPDWLGRAAAYAFVTAEMSGPDGRIQHAWRIGRVTAAGLLDDQAAWRAPPWRCSRRPGAPRISLTRLGWPMPRKRGSVPPALAISRQPPMPRMCRSVQRHDPVLRATAPPPPVML